MTDLIAQFHETAERNGSTVGQLFEKMVRAIYEEWLEPGDFAIDIGAHRGAHLFPMADAVGTGGLVYGFEPLEKLCRQLRRRAKAEGAKNVKLHQLALSDSKGVATFNHFENRPAFSGLRRRGTPFDDEEGGLVKVEVKQTTLDSKLPLFKRVSLIKLDIEGGELHALMGAQRCLMRSRPLVIFENGRQASANVYGYEADDFFAFFDEVNMQVFWLSGEPFTRDQWRARKPCWEFVALPEEKTAFASKLPALCRRVLDAAM